MIQYEILRNVMPDLPVELFDYQVMVVKGPRSGTWSLVSPFLQADVLAAICDISTEKHILSCFPTGYGKTYPMLLASSLSPTGDSHQDCPLFIISSS